MTSLDTPAAHDLPPLLLVHGAWHGAWCFEPLVVELAERGILASTVELPTDAAGAPGDLLDLYVAKVRGALRALSAPAIVLGHSMAGAVLTQLADPASQELGGLIYLAAYVPAIGQCIMDDAKQDGQSEIGSAMLVGPDKLAILNPAVTGPILFGDLGPKDMLAAVQCLRSQNTAIFKAPVAVDVSTSAVPRAYLTCTRDRAIGPQCQREMATRAGCAPVLELDADHAPFLTQPAKCAEFIHKAATALIKA